MNYKSSIRTFDKKYIEDERRHLFRSLFAFFDEILDFHTNSLRC